MVKQKLVSTLKQHFWHYMCVFVLHQEILQFSVDLSWVFYHSVQSDAVCLELGSDYPQGKGLRATRLPPTSDATWESQVVHCSYDWAAVNQGLPWPPLQVGWFARMAHRTQEGMYLCITVHYLEYNSIAARSETCIGEEGGDVCAESFSLTGRHPPNALMCSATGNSWNLIVQGFYRAVQ